ncbi:hypothetical protein [Pseudonocardia sp. TMWB2A]|uniref:hypothetical protein n=1 Tax=Pseudonocardia sp. TMWB2A TaxID=687430 RepID=UPI00307E8B86
MGEMLATSVELRAYGLGEVFIEIDGDKRPLMPSCPADDLRVVIARHPFAHQFAEFFLQIASILLWSSEIKNVEKLSIRHFRGIVLREGETLFSSQFGKKFVPR